MTASVRLHMSERVWGCRGLGRDWHVAPLRPTGAPAWGGSGAEACVPRLCSSPISISKQATLFPRL